MLEEITLYYPPEALERWESDRRSGYPTGIRFLYWHSRERKIRFYPKQKNKWFSEAFVARHFHRQGLVRTPRLLTSSQ